MYNHYQGNSGVVRRVSDISPAGNDRGGRYGNGVGGRSAYGAGGVYRGEHYESAGQYQLGIDRAPQTKAGGGAAPRPLSAPPSGSRRPPSPLSGLSGELGRLLGKLSNMDLETDDLLLLLILYLMYKESRDEELLFIMAAMFFL